MNIKHPSIPSRAGSRGLFHSWTAAIIAVLLGAVSTATAQQTGTVTGRVLNAGTGEYVKYAQVKILGTDQATLSQADGSFRLSNVAAGDARLSVSYTGLDTAEVAVAVPAGGTVVRDVNLTSSEYGEVMKLGEFRVSSAREGNAKAIVEQRVALNVKTVVAADAFGDVSEGNVGEFLKLLPGVSVDYVDNDARSLRIRGLPPKYNTVTLDGNPIANAASSSIVTGRQLELEQVSMAALDIIESTKTPTSDMMSPNLAGNTNAISKSAFNQKGRSIKYQATVNVNEWTPTLSKTKGWDNEEHSKALFGGKVEWVDTFLDGKLGVVMSAAHSGAYAEQRIIIGTYTWDRDAANNSAEIPQVTSWNFQHGLKPTWRDSFLVNLDYKVTDDLKVSLRTNYGYYRSEFYNRNWQLSAGTGTDTASRTETYARYNAPAAGNTNNFARVLGSNQRKSGGTFIISPAATWKHENLKVDASLSYSQAKNAYASGQDGYFSLVQADMRGVSWEYDRVADDSVAVRQLNTGTPNTNSLFDLGNYNAAGQVNNERRNSKDQMWTANIDAEIDFPDWAIASKFKVGAANTLEVRDIHNFQARWSMALAGGPSVANAVGTVNLQDYREAFSGGVGTVTDINGVTSKTPAPDKWRLYELFKSYGNPDPLSLTANGPFVAQAANNLRNLLQNDFDIKEDVLAAYAMATVKPTRSLSLIGGLRFEKTKTSGRGFDDIGPVRSQAIAGTTNTNDLNYIYARYGSRVTRERSYDNVLPIVQARYEVQRNLIARAAYYASLMRPDFQSVVGGISASENTDGSYTFSINNTALEPETADNFDLSLEYYFEPVGVVSATVFHKTIKDIQITRPTVELSDTPAAVQAQIAEAGYSAAELSHRNNRVTTVINGPETKLWGYELAYSQELSFLPGALKGLGVTMNYSHYEPEEERIWVLVPNSGDGMAMDQANLIFRYSLGKFKAQLSGTWTAKRLFALFGTNLDSNGTFSNPEFNPAVPTSGTPNNNVRAYLDERLIVSVNAEYQFHKYATVFAGINNLLNEPRFNFQERPSFTTRYGLYGASINVGVKGSF